MLRDYSLEQKDAQALRKAAKSLAEDFERLLKLYEKQEIVSADLREKVKRLRQEKEAKDKQVDLAHRTIERLTVGKGEVEAKDAAKKSYIKHLETKMASIKDVRELEDAREALETRVLLLERDVRVKVQVAQEAENKVAAVHEELELLKRGIKIAAEQLTTSSGSEVSSEMLLAVARGQEEAASLAQQLADAREKADDFSTALLAARNHLKSQHEVRDQI
jgi:chromosome segregation ATPase